MSEKTGQYRVQFDLTIYATLCRSKRTLKSLLIYRPHPVYIFMSKYSSVTFVATKLKYVIEHNLIYIRNECHSVKAVSNSFQMHLYVHRIYLQRQSFNPESPLQKGLDKCSAIVPAFWGRGNRIIQQKLSEAGMRKGKRSHRYLDKDT